MFWNKKKKEKSETEEDIYEYEGVLSDDDGDETDINKEKTDNEGEDNGEFDAEKDGDFTDEEEADGEFNAEEYFKNGEESDVADEGGEDEALAATVTVKVDSLNALAEFVALRHPINLQFMKKESPEVFELREAHLRIARVWGTVSMSRECTAEEYAKIMLAIELLESPDDFYVLPALTESDIKEAMADFCEEKYGVGGRKAAGNPKKFARLVEENGDKEEWKLYVKELLYKKTADFCEENGITFSLADEEETNE